MSEPATRSMLLVTVAVEVADEATRDTVTRGLRAFNLRYAPPAEPAPIHVIARRAGGSIVGGLLGSTVWVATGRGTLLVDALWVAEGERGQGLGSALLGGAEEEARRRGCCTVVLDTIEFQARGFYERHGYRVIGEQEDFPPGYRRTFMAKRLCG